MSKFGSAHSNPESPWKGQVFAEQKLGTGYQRIQDRNKSRYRQPLEPEPRGSLGGSSYPPEHKRDWRAGEFQRQDKEITFRKRARDPGTGKFTAVNQKTLRLKYVRPADPGTESQILRRTVFTDGVIAAQALSDAEKGYYKSIADQKIAQTWFSVFMSEYLRSH